MLIDWFTVAAQAVNFLILVWLMKHFLYQPILHAIDERDKHIADELANAAAKEADAVKEREEFQKKNTEFDQQRAALLAKATDEAKTERQRLVDEARREADDLRSKRQKTLASDERKKASYFFRKGKSMGDYQFQNYLEAYYGFLELHREDPRDQEVAQFWELSRQKAAERTLFSEEMNVLFQVPGSENVVFLNRETPLEVVRIGKLLNTSQGVFVKDLEFLRMDATGEVLLHWTAPYGRWAEDGIDFRVWDKDSPTPRFPTVLAETAGNEFNPQGTVDPPRLVPRVSVRDLELVTAHDPQPQTVGGYQGASFWESDEHDAPQWANIKSGTPGVFTDTSANPGISGRFVPSRTRACRFQA